MSNHEAPWISQWDPEDEKFWEAKGKFVARRHLVRSIVAAVGV